MSNGQPKDRTVSNSYTLKASVDEFLETVCETLEIENKSAFISDAILSHGSFLLSQNPIIRKQFIKKLQELS